MSSSLAGPGYPRRFRGSIRTHRLYLAAAKLRVTYVLIALNVAAFLAEEGQLSGSGTTIHGRVIEEGVLDRHDVINAHQYWRLVSNAFLHENIKHIASNMLGLFLFGLLLEPVIGRARFTLIYLTALLGGSLGALLATPAAGLGASGAVFGLMGALAVLYYARGISVIRSGLVPLIALSLYESFTTPHISVGAHIGGLIAGTVASLVIWAADRRGSLRLGVGGCLVLCLLVVVGSATIVAPSGAPVRFENYSSRALLARFATCMRLRGVNVYKPHFVGRRFMFQYQGTTSRTAVSRAASKCDAAFRQGD
jgi:membrane associated rhomboid family serine protease